MGSRDYTQNYSWSEFTPVDSTGEQRSVVRSAYKNLRFTLDLQEITVLSDSDAMNLPGLSYKYYGTVDFWRILLGYNGIQDPLQEIYAGLRFRIPTRDSVVRWLNQQQSTTSTVLRV